MRCRRWRPSSRSSIGPGSGVYNPADHELLVSPTMTPGSVALIPLPRDNRAIGVIAFCSRDPKRFTGDLAADFLAHLGVDRRDQPRKRGESRPAGAQRRHGFPDRLAQPPLFPQSPARRAGARRTHRQDAGLPHDRHRQLQGDQRSLRPPGGRRGTQGSRAARRSRDSRGRHRRALRWRRVRDPAGRRGDRARA